MRGCELVLLSVHLGMNIYKKMGSWHFGDADEDNQTVNKAGA